MLLKVCSRSQGQPRCGSRRRAISPSSAPRARSASLIGVRSDTQPIERDEHPGGGAPDVAVAEGDFGKLEFRAGDGGAAAVPVGIGGIEQGNERRPQRVPNPPRREQQPQNRPPPGPPPPAPKTGENTR